VTIRYQFLTKSKDGIYHYQRWVPSRIYDSAKFHSKVFKISLRTEQKSVARRLSRIITVKFDDLITQYFDDADSFATAMKNLYEVVGAKLSLEEYEDLGYEGYDDWLLGKGINLNNRVNEQFQKMTAEIEFLKKTISDLRSSNSLNLKDLDDENSIFFLIIRSNGLLLRKKVLLRQLLKILIYRRSIFF